MRPRVIATALSTAFIATLPLLAQQGMSGGPGGGGGRLSPASLDMDTCGCPTTFGQPACEQRTSWTLTKTTSSGPFTNPQGEPFSFDVTVTEGATTETLYGDGQLVITNSGDQTTLLSSVVVMLDKVHSGPGKGTGVGPSGKNWDLLSTVLENESAACDAAGVARTCYGELLEDAGNFLVLYDAVSNDIIALSDQLPVPPTKDNDGDGLRDEDPALPSDPSLITGGCSVIDNDKDGLFDEDPIDGIDNDGDGKIDEDDPDDDGDGLVDEDGACEDAVVINFHYEFDITGLGISGPGDGVVPSDDDLRINSLITFNSGGLRGGTCSVDLDCDGIDDDNVRTIQQRLRFDPVDCDPVCQTVTLEDTGAVANDPGCVAVTSDTLYTTIPATGAAGMTYSFQVNGTVDCTGGQCATNVVNTATLTCDDGSLITGSPATASFLVECNDPPPGISEGDFCTQTQGGWGTNCNGNNPGCLRDQFFDALFPGGLVVGDADGPDGDGSYAILLNSSQAVADYLPAGGPPKALTADQTDPLTTSAGVFGGQLVAATLNVKFDEAGLGLCTLTGSCSFPFAPGTLGTLVFREGCVADGLVGVTVNQVLDWANCAISGADLAGCGVPAGVTIPDLSDALARLNQEYVDCDTVVGCLEIQAMALALNSDTGNQLLQFPVPLTGIGLIVPVVYTLPAFDVLDIAVSDNGRTAIVSDFNGFRVLVLDVTAGPVVLGSIPVPMPAEDVDMAMTPDREYSLVVDGNSFYDRQVSSLDIENFTVIDTLILPFPYEAQSVDILPFDPLASGYFAVTCSFYHDRMNVMIIEPDGTLDYVGDADSGPGLNSPLNVTGAPDGTQWLIAHLNGIAQWFLSPSGSITLNATLTNASFSPPLGRVQSIAFKPDGSEVYLLDNAFQQVAILSVGAGNVLTDTGVRIPVGPAPSYFGVDQIAVDRTGARLLVNCSDGLVYLIDLTTRTVVDQLPTGNFEGGGIVFQR